MMPHAIRAELTCVCETDHLLNSISIIVIMDPEEAELQNDYRYRSYSVVIEKALRSFESFSEWADLISSLGKLNKVLLSHGYPS
ncbi:hypothetical protein CRUP_007268 [Coryphaenoides rupestris]|nr:hypothetical protein CRUP_007268 [Coryphaenoides rupestris]